MIEVYAHLIFEGFIELEDVPKNVREEVAKLL